jgi:hypothetical protein
MVKFGLIDAADVDLFHRSNTVDEAFDYITTELVEYAVDHPGGEL